MKKLLVSIGACLLLTCGFGAAKDTTFSGEIMDQACAKGGGHESMFKKMGTDDPKACTVIDSGCTARVATDLRSNDL